VNHEAHLRRSRLIPRSKGGHLDNDADPSVDSRVDLSGVPLLRTVLSLGLALIKAQCGVQLHHTTLYGMRHSPTLAELILHVLRMHFDTITRLSKRMPSVLRDECKLLRM
jgi:hypothetical protein